MWIHDTIQTFYSIYRYLISEGRWNIYRLWPSQRRNRDPVKIWTYVEMDGRISQ